MTVVYKWLTDEQLDELARRLDYMRGLDNSVLGYYLRLDELASVVAELRWHRARERLAEEEQRHRGVLETAPVWDRETIERSMARVLAAKAEADNRLVEMLASEYRPDARTILRNVGRAAASIPEHVRPLAERAVHIARKMRESADSGC